MVMTPVWSYSGYQHICWNNSPSTL